MTHLFFDLDGTLTDPAEGIIASLQHALRAMSAPARSDAELRGYIGPPLRECFRELLPTQNDALVEKAVAHFRERFGTKGLFENALYAGIPEALAELQGAGFQLSVVTSKATVYAARIVRSVGVLWGYGTRSELEAAGADAVVESIRELPAAVHRLMH